MIYYGIAKFYFLPLPSDDDIDENYDYCDHYEGVVPNGGVKRESEDIRDVR